MYAHHPSNTQEQNNIYATFNTFSHAYIVFQHTLSYSKSVTNNQTCERREKERKRGKECERIVNEKETYMRKKRIYHGQ
jgi:hypothetical protein